MMLSKAEAGKKLGDNSGNGKLLHEIETISKALYLDKNPSRNSSYSAYTRPISFGKAQSHDSKLKPKVDNEDPSRKDKKSIWNWRPLKALSHIRNRRFNCCFSLQVHSIEELPLRFDDASLCVYWKRRDAVLVTRPAKVFKGIVEFDEKLTYTCSVYGSRSGPHHSAKYEAKHFLLYASVSSAPELDLGKHRVDLTRLLPLTLEELEEEQSPGKWTTSFRLSGKAKGAIMNVSFGYLVVGDNCSASANNNNAPSALTLKQNTLSLKKPEKKSSQGDGRSGIHHIESLPSSSSKRSYASSQSVEAIKDLHEVLPVSRSELASSVDILYQKLDEDNFSSPINFKPEYDGLTEDLQPMKPDSCPLSDSGKENTEQCESNEFSVTDQGVELSSEEPVKSEELMSETADVSSVHNVDTLGIDSGLQVSEDVMELQNVENDNISSKDDSVACECAHKDDDSWTKELLMQELESALNSVSDLEIVAMESPKEQNYMELKSERETNKIGKSHSLDDDTESVAIEFLNMLGIEHSPFGLSSESEPESPREILLRKFEEEALAGGFSLFDFDVGDEDEVEGGYNASTGSGLVDFMQSYKTSSLLQNVHEEHQVESQMEQTKTRAKMLEDLETEALMREWGLNERAFEHSPPKSSAGFGSPIDLPPDEALELPSLADGLGPYIQTKDGGFLRSMNPSLFRNAKSGGNLVMQVSSPVVVPAEMGSGIMEILQHLASVGIEKLSMQASKLMPLEDITGKTMQQVAWEAIPALDGPESQCLLQHDTVSGQDMTGVQKGVKGTSDGLMSNKLCSSSVGNGTGSEYVSLEDLAPLAMDKIEALSVEGLRIQSGMSNEDAPSNISVQSIGDISALQGKGLHSSGSLGLEGTAGLQLLDIKDFSGDVDGIMDLSLTLDEWMRLDSGEIDDVDQISERTSKILAAHHANSFDLIRGGSKGDRKRGKGPGRKCGLLGNNFTVALMVQLRDPLRNYEPVGTPMLSLIQVERVFVPPKPKIYSTVSEVRNSNEEDDETESGVKLDKKEDKNEERTDEKGIPQYKITEVHVAGLKTEPGKKKLWGTSTQQQSGSRWLMANGMGKSNKHPFMKSKTLAKSGAPVSTKAQPGDSLWSISSRAKGTGAKRKELAAINPHTRNPNVTFPNGNML
ncbi:protein PLASTID MOVEMENT IMPAIRED 1-RELATED 1 [Quillaja saponaria]|uniref:Protein PLASTID MOVEMENT IMPAIRED 1-RELATED 1 n=1 Tax=Quillaja saponaria TaxID=32244 RepID=A0AAD7LD57_QUISA|nr:protein PLASTID MOVEMENT IMPAIRED 1-RELATED 1 [Quillaja saponaria]